MDLEGMAPKLETKIGIPIVVARANGLDYAFTQGEDIVLVAMAHRCSKQSLLGDEREDYTRSRYTKVISSPSLRKRGVNNLKKHPPLVLFGSLPSTMASQLSLELRRQSFQVSGWLLA
jgi:light-independent protochlorophyllide reductase subunit N